MMLKHFKDKSMMLALQIRADLRGLWKISERQGASVFVSQQKLFNGCWLLLLLFFFFHRYFNAFV
jgi:hypothetical protein